MPRSPAAKARSSLTHSFAALPAIAGLPTPSAGNAESWLLLIHQLPAKPAYLRVRVWRRLHTLGAVPIKNAVHALPANAQTQEDFAWLAREIVEAGGEAIVCEARLVAGHSDLELRAQFDRARDLDYEAIANDARSLAERLDAEPAASEPEAHAAAARRADAAAQLVRLQARLAATTGVDFFGARGRDVVEGILYDLSRRLREGSPSLPERAEPAASVRDLRRRTWVTRRGVHVDRMASAWLIRRFIDPEPRFKFVAARDYQPSPGELRFDMFEAEFTHRGDRCTFEVLLELAAPGDAALHAIAEIVHDIDLKDDKFGRPEVGGIATLIGGICLATRDDDERVARGGAVFDDLYAFFGAKRER